jgi:hypothetical protein
MDHISDTDGPTERKDSDVKQIYGRALILI